MFVFAPPVKVARTQRHSRLAVQHSSSSGDVTEFASTHPPTDMEQTTVQTGSCAMEASQFLSGTGKHMCWLVDENKKLIRVWNVAAPHWRRTEPRVVPIPYFASAQEGLPLFVSEMDDVEESLAFCTDRGAVSSLDHSVEFQLLEQNDTVAASCFACMRRNDCGDVVLTAIGTTAGSMVIDVKQHGEHHTVEFDRRDASGDVLQRIPQSSSRDASGGGRWWKSFRSILGGGGRSRGDTDVSAEGTSSSSSPVSSFQDSLLDVQNGGLSFTFAVFRSSYPQELVCANAASELILLDFTQRQVTPRWAVNVQSVLGKDGYIVAVSECRHKVCVLFLTQPPTGGALPALVLATFGSTKGNLINYTIVNGIADVVKAVAEVPRHHIKLYVDDEHSHVLFTVRHMLVRVNMQVGVRDPCSSEDTLFLKGLHHPLGSVLMDDGSVILLDSAHGPVHALDDAWSHTDAAGAASSSSIAVRGPDAAPAFTGSLYEADMEQRISSILAAVRADSGKLKLDDVVLGTSDELSVMRDSHSGNWARSDLNAEDDNIVLFVTRNLKKRQQIHRRFVVGLLSREAVMSELKPSTVAALLSTQEALLSHVALRGLQNVGTASSTEWFGRYATLGTFASYVMPLRVGLDSSRFGSEGDGSDKGASEFTLVESAEQLERCQQILRRCIVSVAEQLRAAHAGESSNNNSSVTTATAVELVFSDPKHVSMLLCHMGEYLCSVIKTVSLDPTEKFAEAYAVGCLYVIVAQTIVESRETLREVYTPPAMVRECLWTHSDESVMSVRLAFSHICSTLSNALAETVIAPALHSNGPIVYTGDDEEGACLGGPARALPRAMHSVLFSEQHDMCNLVAYILYFSFKSQGAQDQQYFASALKATFLREPFISEPFGYPFGAPKPTVHAPQLGLRALRICESLALSFDASEIIMAMCLAAPVEDPQPEDYERLQSYCRQHPRVIEFALEELWRSRREWELLCLPAVLPLYPEAAPRRDAFLERCCPHLLWLASPSRFDGLRMEGAVCPPYIPYGDSQLSHRSRCLSMSTLAWVASGAPQESVRRQMLLLDAAVVKAQGSFLSPQCDSMLLGPQEVVQRLISTGNVAAWMAAADVSSLTQEPLSEDLLLQVVRRCKEADGDAYVRLQQNSVSELETSRAMQQTALGQVVLSCTYLQQYDTLTRICETVLSREELMFLMAWLASEGRTH